MDFEVTEDNEPFLRAKFKDGLKKSIRIQISMLHDKSLADLRKAAENVEANLSDTSDSDESGSSSSDEDTKKKKKRTKKKSQGVDTNVIASLTALMTNTMQQLQAIRAQPPVVQPVQPVMQPMQQLMQQPMQANNGYQNGPRRKPKCYYCGQLGHIVRNCQAKAAGRPPIPSYKPRNNNQNNANVVPTASVLNAPAEAPAVFPFSMFTVLDIDNADVSGNTIMSDKVSRCSTDDESCSVLANTDETANESDEVSKAKEHIATSTEAYNDVHVLNEMSNKKGQSEMSCARSGFSNSFRCLLTVVLVSAFLFTGAHGNPMVCRTTYPMGRFSISNNVSCYIPAGSSSITNKLITVYKRNLVQYDSDAFLCRTIKTKVVTMVGFFHEHHRKTTSHEQMLTTFEECRRMIHFKSSKHGGLIKQGDIWGTNNEVNFVYKSGFQCCRPHEFSAINSYLVPAKVYKRHDDAEMESPDGIVRHCTYSTGYCALPNKDALIWTPNPQEQCQFLMWRTFNATQMDNTIITEDKELAFSFTKDGGELTFTPREGCSNASVLLLSDQGMAVSVRNRLDRKKRSGNGTAGYVLESELNARLQAFETRLLELSQENFKLTAKAICMAMREAAVSLTTSFKLHPTLTTRHILGNEYLTAKVSGDVLSVYPCVPLDSYTIVKAPGCTDRVAINATISGENHTLYFDPTDNIVHAHPGPETCLSEIPVKIKGINYLYHPESGSLEKITSSLPQFHVLNLNFTQLSTLVPDTPVIHELIIHDFNEFKDKYSLNDMLGGIEHNQAILANLGELSADPKLSAKSITRHLESKVRFPGLFGLKPSAGSIWQWLTNLAVILAVIVVLIIGIKLLIKFVKVKRKQKPSAYVLPSRPKRARRGSNSSEVRSPNTNITVTTSNTNEQRPLLQPIVPPPMPPPSFSRLYPDLNDITDLATTRSRLDRLTFLPASLRNNEPEIIPLSPLLSSAPAACVKHKSLVTATVNGKQVKCLLDTGAMKSVLSKDAVKSLGLKAKCVKKEQTLLPFSGIGIPAIGEVTANVQLEDQTIKSVNFLVLESLHYPCVLGVDLFEKLPGIVFKYSSSGKGLTVVLPTASNAVSDKDNDDHEFIHTWYISDEPIYLPAKHRVFMNRPYPSTDDMLFEPVMIHSDIVTAAALNKSGTISLQFINTGDFDLVIDAGTPLGVLSILPTDIAVNAISSKPENDKTDETDPISKIDLSKSDVSAKDKETFLDFLRSKIKAFSTHPMDLGRVYGVTGEVCPTTDEIPIHKQPYRVPHSQKQSVDEHIQQLVNHGLIEKASNPCCCSPVVVVGKKTGGFRICQDYRALNAKTRALAYPLPIQETVRDVLAGTSLFTTLDISQAYYQLALDNESDMDKGGFITSTGVYRPKVLMFGWKNSPSVFQRAMNCILQNLEYPEIFCFLDDILIASENNVQQHMKRVGAVLDRLIAVGIKINGQKSHWLQSKVTYLGHEYSKAGVRPSSSNVAKFLSLERPKDLRSLRRVLGAFNFYSMYIEKFAHHAKPLYKLLQKEFTTDAKWEWGNAQETAFTYLRQKLTQAPCLIHPVWGEPFHLYADASIHALGAHLCQKPPPDLKLHPIAFFSRATSPAETRYSIIEREALAIVEACEHWRPFIYGYPIHVYTDHQPLKYIFSSVHKNNRLAKYALRLQEFQIELNYIKGADNHIADLLSRDVDNNEIIACTAIYYEANNNTDYKALQAQDALLVGIMQFIDKSKISEDVKAQLSESELSYITQHTSEYFMDNDVLHKLDSQTKRPLLVVPTALRNDIFHLYHTSLFGSHQGVKRTTKRIKQKYFWPGIDSDIKDKCKKCIPCNLRKGNTADHALTPIPCIAPFERVSVDVAGPMRTTSRGNTYILAFTDAFTKWVILLPVPHHDADTVSEALIDHVILNFTTPRYLLSDRGAEFTSQLFGKLLEKLNIAQRLTTAYNPQTNGMSERFFSTCSAMISALLQMYPDEWDIMTKYVAHAYNNTEHTSTGFSPKFLLHGTDSELPYDMLWPKSAKISYIDDPDTVDSITSRLHQAWWLAKDNIEQAQVSYKAMHDSKRLAPVFEDNDVVYVKTPVHDANLPNKFRTRFTGPYIVIKTQGPVATCKKLSSAGTPVGVPFIVNVRRLKKSLMPDDLTDANQYDHQPQPAKRTPVAAPRTNVHRYNLRPRN